MNADGFAIRCGPKAVALETTLLLHGVPHESCMGLAAELEADVRSSGAEPALIGVVAGVPTVGMTHAELALMRDAESVPKANTSNLGVLIARKSHAATTVSTTMEIAAVAGVKVFATGGLGGVHQGWATHLDISTDLFALTRFPVAVVASGVKSLLDIPATREALETLGVPVIGVGTDRFPAFYLRHSDAKVDARIDDVQELARFVNSEIKRTGRGVLIAHPIPEEHEIDAHAFERWLMQARKHAEEHGAKGRDVTPAILGALHLISGGATLRANIALVRANARLAGRLRAAMEVA
ncbi:MAG: pseudouridine-5'-phosphate glycosidase [Phycisphaerales bacterium]